MGRWCSLLGGITAVFPMGRPLGLLTKALFWEMEQFLAHQLNHGSEAVGELRWVFSRRSDCFFS